MTQTAAVPTPAEVARNSRSEEIGKLTGYTVDKTNGKADDGTLTKYVCHVDMSGFTAADAATAVRDYLGRKIDSLLRTSSDTLDEVKRTHRLDITAAELMSGRRARTVVVQQVVSSEDVIAQMVKTGASTDQIMAKVMEMASKAVNK